MGATETTTAAASMRPGTFVLPLPDVQANAVTQEPSSALPDSLLVQNILWFCRLRWGVIALLLAFGSLGLSPGLLAQLRLRPPGWWPFLTAAVLLIANVLFLASSRSLNNARLPGRVRLNLRSQIVLDLVVLTVVVHFVGAVTTYALFAYLFHAVLACLFFSRHESLAVVLLAIALYALCIGAERLGLVRPATVLAGEPGAVHSRASMALNSLLAVAIWISVWYLSSHLAAMVRQQESELAATNQRLLAAQAERSRHMLMTTHQLKAPFAAIDANVQLLLSGMCGPLTDETREVSLRIAARCRRLASEIQEMLQLANLGSASQHPPDRVRVNLADVMSWCIRQVEPLAGQRGVSIAADVSEAWALAAEDHIRMLFGNLLSNAVIYSHPGGRVSVRCLSAPLGEAVVIIADHGIGIAPEKLPRIFEEHYRTREAIQHNKESSGLGLSIVRHVAELYGVQLIVESHPGHGTTFSLTFVPAPDDGGSTEEGERPWPT